jgi:PPK2 family polyphosphate:nucleotide phosphotransferase
MKSKKPKKEKDTPLESEAPATTDSSKNTILLTDFSTKAPDSVNKKDIEKATEKLAKRIGELQFNLTVEKKRGLLIIIQGMDASGKDGILKTVFADCNPGWLRVAYFKKPTEEEFAHDFLWRIHKNAPAKGETVIFNRSQYEDVLIHRVHKWIDDDHAAKRFASINAFEELLQYDNKTTILKFYLHLSHERQLEKLQERIDVPEKNWKHNPGDWEETKLWDDYMRCYEDLLNRSTLAWNLIPADDRWYRNYCVAKIVCEALEQLNPQLPLLAKA